MKTITAVRAAGDTHPGLQREVNEDRFHVDLARGLFIVVDGVGGQAAGGKAADLAMRMLRTRLERETGTVADRVREAITVANNEIRRVSSLRSEWHGMACVLTVAVVEDGRAIVGHVGDTRLYKLRNGAIEKATRDHSPVGEREDAQEISEIEAMRHPRRNEVYRDVGSEMHDAFDPDFIDLHELTFEPDAALLLCSDGLTDLVDSATIREAATRFAGRPNEVVRALIQAANDAGGKDNVTVVYVEGDQFEQSSRTVETRRLVTAPALVDDHEPQAQPIVDVASGEESPSRHVWRTIVRASIVLLIGVVLGYALLRFGPRNPFDLPRTLVRVPGLDGQILVTPSESIAAAVASAPAGGTVVVQPGEYRERVVLADGVRVVSLVPRGATIRLPSTASEGDPAIVADGVSGAELVGFRIVGDAATPLGTAILAKSADISIVDVEITGAAHCAIDVRDAAHLTLLGSHLHDNPGVALAVRGRASPRVSQNVFVRNGLSERASAALIVEPNTRPAFVGNVFQGIASEIFRGLGEEGAARVARDNFFVDGHEPPVHAAAGQRRGR